MRLYYEGLSIGVYRLIGVIFQIFLNGKNFTNNFSKKGNILNQKKYDFLINDWKNLYFSLTIKQ